MARSRASTSKVKCCVCEKKIDIGKPKIVEDEFVNTIGGFKSILNELKTSEDIVLAKKHNVNFKESVKGKSDEEILNAVIYFIDNKQVFKTKSMSNEKLFVLLSAEIQTGWAGKVEEFYNTKLLEVDYVRYYKNE